MRTRRQPLQPGTTVGIGHRGPVEVDDDELCAAERVIGRAVAQRAGDGPGRNRLNQQERRRRRQHIDVTISSLTGSMAISQWSALMTKLPCFIAVVVTAVSPACSGDSLGPDSTPPVPTSLQAAVTNPFFPLPPGTTQVFNTQTAAGLEVDSVTVLANTKMVNGFAATEVHDHVHLAG